MQETLRRPKPRGTYVKEKQMELESESEMVHYAKRGLEQVLAFPKFLLYLIALILQMSLMFLLLPMVVFVILVMFVKDWLVGLIRLCWEVCYQVPKNHLEKLRK